MDYLFTADHHFGHENIIGYCNRPFPDAATMDAEMIVRWNSKVKLYDTVIYLGDFTLGADAQKYFEQLNGHIRYVGSGHHDRRWQLKFNRDHYGTNSGPVEWWQPLVTLDGEPPVVVCHFPLAVWDRKYYGAWHLHAHSHSNYEAEGKILDVGVDNHDFYPLSYDEVKEIMDTK